MEPVQDQLINNDLLNCARLEQKVHEKNKNHIIDLLNLNYRD